MILLWMVLVWMWCSFEFLVMLVVDVVDAICLLLFWMVLMKMMFVLDDVCG